MTLDAEGSLGRLRRSLLDFDRGDIWRGDGLVGICTGAGRC